MNSEEAARLSWKSKNGEEVGESVKYIYIYIYINIYICIHIYFIAFTPQIKKQIELSIYKTCKVFNKFQREM